MKREVSSKREHVGLKVKIEYKLFVFGEDKKVM